MSDLFSFACLRAGALFCGRAQSRTISGKAPHPTTRLSGGRTLNSGFQQRVSFPEQRIIRQRLMHSRLLLISTSKSISEIGNECTFPNTSHFIKLFKKEYQMTPATYRHKHLTSLVPEPALNETAEAAEMREAL